MNICRIWVVFLAIFAPLSAVWAVPVAASPVFFTEVDDDEQLHYALTAVYPKLTLPLKRYQEKGGLRSC